jgi:hypothetical protein
MPCLRAQAHNRRKDSWKAFLVATFSRSELLAARSRRRPSPEPQLLEIPISRQKAQSTPILQGSPTLDRRTLS